MGVPDVRLIWVVGALPPTSAPTFPVVSGLALRKRRGIGTKSGRWLALGWREAGQGRRVQCLLSPLSLGPIQPVRKLAAYRAEGIGEERKALSHGPTVYL